MQGQVTISLPRRERIGSDTCVVRCTCGWSDKTFAVRGIDARVLAQGHNERVHGGNYRIIPA